MITNSVNRNGMRYAFLHVCKMMNVVFSSRVVCGTNDLELMTKFAVAWLHSDWETDFSTCIHTGKWNCQYCKNVNHSLNLL